MSTIYFRDVVSALIPLRMEAGVGMIAGFFGVVLSFLFGGWTDIMNILIAFMAVDYVSGVLAAYINPHLALNSQRGARGIATKILKLLLVAMGHWIDVLLGTNNLAMSAAVFFYVSNEGLSILENCAKAGVPIPDKLAKTLEQLSNEKQERRNMKEKEENRK